MSQTKIEQLTPEQEALIPVYWEKWKRIIFSTEPINCQKATAVVKAAYAWIGEKPPEIIFFDSPKTALIDTLIKLRKELGNEWNNLDNRDVWDVLYIPEDPARQLVDILRGKLETQLTRQLESQLNRNLESNLFWQLWNRPLSQREIQLESQLELELELEFEEDHYIRHDNLSRDNGVYDFCFSVLNCDCDQKTWYLFQSLAKECGWIFPFEKICLVCDRPRILSFDNEQRLHAEGSPAIQFADGYSLYSYHGVTLPEKYGVLHPNQWQAKWLLEEDNAELRRVLMQGIGYGRICQELEAEELDTWQEYILLKIDNDVDIEQIYLLKMTCPSTGFIHALRVPPDVKSAREAIRWVNWGIDPEEFSVQT